MCKSHSAVLWLNGPAYCLYSNSTIVLYLGMCMVQVEDLLCVRHACIRRELYWVIRTVISINTGVEEVVIRVVVKAVKSP